MNKKILVIGTILYIVFVGTAGFLLYAKQSPIAWDADQSYSACHGEWTVEDCTGSQEQGSPFLESYISGDFERSNDIAKATNGIIGISTIGFIFISLVYFSALWRLSTRPADPETNKIKQVKKSE